MKSKIKRKTLALVLAISMILMSLPISGIAVAGENNTAPFTNPFSQEVQFNVNGKTESSHSYRIPSMVTLADGTIVAAADIRWNTTYDGGGLDTLVARSTDGGANWSYTVANYLGDNGNQYNSQSTTFIDPNLLVAADGQTVYMLVDLYAYGIALNGNGSQIMPVADTGFDANGNLKLSNNSHSSYDYYLKDGKIYDYSNNVVEGYEVDAYFNVTYTQNGETKKSNLFYSDSPFKVVRTQYLYLTKSTDGGATWSEPNLLDVRAKAKVAATENALLVSPGNSITTSDGFMVYPTYSFIDSDHQALALIYSDDGVHWERSTDYTALKWSSEGAIVELQNGNLRVFVRNRTGYLCYVDFNMNTMSWIGHTQTTVPTNSNTQLSAITYSKTFNGNQVILVSCPTGPNEAGSTNNDGSYRTNGKIFVGVVAADGTMTWPESINVSPVTATGQLSGTTYTENQGFFAYSCLTERSDGSIAILYENNQFRWGAGDDKYFTINAKAYFSDNLGLPFDDEKVIDRTATIRDGVTSVTLYADPSDSSGTAINVTTDVLPEIMAISGMYYDDASGILFYKVRAGVGFEWPEAYSTYSYIPADAVDLRTDYGIAIPIVDFTNAAPLVRSASIPQPATYKLRSSARTLSLSKAASNSSSGLVLDKTVTDNGDGTYKVNLEAYTTGTVTVQQGTKPMDIVLVLDQSGSMAYCIGCGSDNENVSSGEYHATYDVSTDGIYYYQQSYGNYSRLYYCSTCSGWHISQNHSVTKYTPKSSDDDWGNTQFYVECESRLSALKSAVQAFVDEVYKKAAGADGLNGTPDDVAHRIAIVGFASQYDYGYNTELLSINGNNSGTVGINYNNISTEDYVAVLQDLSVTSSKAVLDTAIAALAAQGVTRADLGMKMAENIFANNTVDLAQRDRITIMFTDGSPTTGGNFETNVANKAIESAKKLKNDYSSTVYTVGVFDGADASSPSSLPTSYTSSPNRENRYMHLVSSNYMNATKMDNTGTVNPNLTGDNGYYLSAGNTTALNKIFKNISSSVGSSSSDLTSTAVVKDIVTPQFVIPDGVSNVEVYQIPYDPESESGWGTPEQLYSSEVVTIDKEENSVNVTGFDFKHNFVAETGRDENDLNKEGEFYGRKLQIVFTVSVDPYFLGGSNVPTNGAESGVYDGDGNCVGNFNQPVFAIPLREISTVVQDKNVYLTNTVDLTTLLNLYVQGDQPGENLHITVDGINNAYVDLEYTIKLNDNTVAVYEIPAGKKWSEGTWKKNQGELLRNYLATDDTPFTVTCVMTDAANPSDLDPSSTTATDIATVYVYKPTVTFQDATKIPNSESVDYAKDNFVSVVWLHGTTDSKMVTMEGTMPTLTYTYSTPSGCIDSNGLVITYNEFYVNVTKVLSTGNKGDIDITNYVTFAHKDCPCGFVASNGEFMIHLTQVYTSLVIQKAGWEAIDPNQSFIFNVVEVDANGNPIDNTTVTVTVHENGSITIDGLLVNRSYMVTEDTSWSWRYTFSNWVYKSSDADLAKSGTTNNAIITLGSKNNVITFTNTRSIIWWLDGDSWCNNIFKNPNE